MKGLTLRLLEHLVTDGDKEVFLTQRLGQLVYLLNFKLIRNEECYDNIGNLCCGDANGLQ